LPIGRADTGVRPYNAVPAQITLSTSILPRRRGST